LRRSSRFFTGLVRVAAACAWSSGSARQRILLVPACSALQHCLAQRTRGRTLLPTVARVEPRGQENVAKLSRSETLEVNPKAISTRERMLIKQLRNQGAPPAPSGSLQLLILVLAIRSYTRMTIEASRNVHFHRRRTTNGAWPSSICICLAASC
jgi:hypothetical protein